MFTSLFFIFCALVILFGICFVIMTIRHHFVLADRNKSEKNLASQLAEPAEPL